MKKLILIFLVLLGIQFSGLCQVKLIQGRTTDFQIEKQPDLDSYLVGPDYYFIFTKRNGAEFKRTLLIIDKDGNTKTAGNIEINAGVITNMNSITDIIMLGNKMYVLVENRNKETGKNTLSIHTLGNSGEVSEDGTEISSMDFKKFNNSGYWNAYVTADKQHLSIVFQQPFEKEQPLKFQYFFMDATLKVLKSGDFNLPGENNKTTTRCYASDKGEIYLVRDKFEKWNPVPNVYKPLVSSEPFKVLLNEPQKIFNYTTEVDPAGNLVLAGYYHENKTVTVGETKAKGVWIYRSDISEVKSTPFTNPTENLTSRGIVFNGNTFFLIGEQYKEERESDVSKAGTTSFEYNYNYTHKDIVVTGFETSTLSKKFDVIMNKDWKSRNFNSDLFQSYGIINGKLAVIYNDNYTKYVANSSYNNYKLPVLNFVTNDGLMEPTIHFEKEFHMPDYSFTLFPQLFCNKGNDEIIVLGKNQSGLSGVIFKVK
ncbi:MAG: hypothetical protein HXX09_16030 [Bacteroidetes bacterium]|nr:hypothetical protein [Bacteroidota bacterium]